IRLPTFRCEADYRSRRVSRHARLSDKHAASVRLRYHSERQDRFMLWACLHFSDLPLRAVFDTDELRQRCAIVAGPRQRPLIVAANDGAQRAGVRQQHVLAAARAICADLQARVRDTTAEHRLLHSLAAWAYRFSSHVSL